MKYCVLAVPVLTMPGTHTQFTTRGSTGLVKDARGELSIETMVRALHTPSSTTDGAATNVDRRLTIQNMRVGRPYTVEVSYVVGRTTTRNDIVLQLTGPTC